VFGFILSGINYLRLLELNIKILMKIKGRKFMKTLQEIKDYLVEQGCEDSLVFENPAYESAFIGVSDNDLAIYDYQLMVEYLVENDNADYVDAVDFISYNTLRSLPYYEKSPIVLFRCLD